MPTRLRPTAPIARDAILVGDPGRALMLAQALLEQPKMSNHARGLWGYSGRSRQGRELTIQSTGMGGPSAALVLTELAGLGVQKAVRIGTCLAPAAQPGDRLLVERAIAEGGSAPSFGPAVGDSVAPDAGLTTALRAELGEEVAGVTVASFDMAPDPAGPLPEGAAAADLQTVAILSRSAALGVRAAAILIAEATSAGSLDDEARDRSATLAGEAAAAVL